MKKSCYPAHSTIYEKKSVHAKRADKSYSKMDEELNT